MFIRLATDIIFVLPPVKKSRSHLSSLAEELEMTLPMYKRDYKGRGGGQVVSVLPFYSDNPSSNPTDVYNFSVKLLLKRTKINKKTPG